jgi:hypothetical protein
MKMIKLKALKLIQKPHMLSVLMTLGNEQKVVNLRQGLI